MVDELLDRTKSRLLTDVVPLRVFSGGLRKGVLNDDLAWERSCDVRACFAADDGPDSEGPASARAVIAERRHPSPAFPRL